MTDAHGDGRPPTTAGRCDCLGDDAAAAKSLIQKSARIAELVDDSHFMVAVRRCSRCGQHFITLFCERVDWADGDDPQTWLAAPITQDEVQALQRANVAADENVIPGIVNGVRRILYHDMPKGAPSRLEWMRRPMFIPAHD